MRRVPGWLKDRLVRYADRIVYASGAYVSLKSSINDLSPVVVRFEGDPAGDADARLREVVQSLRPVTAQGLHLTRIGGRADGGYVMASPVDAVGAVSIGVGSDVSWDLDMSALGIPVAMFDHTVRVPPTTVPGGRFHRVGVGPVERGSTKPLSSLIRMAQFPQKGDLVLKMDVEGSEWDVLAAIERPDLSCFSQIVVELHGFSQLRNEDSGKRVIAAVEHLTSLHSPVHIHANNYDPLRRFDRWWFPDTLEVSLVRKDVIPGAEPARSLRSDLDVPCDPRVSDIDLSGVLR